jgi:hypothetical protein
MQNDTLVLGDFGDFYGKFNILICPSDRAHIEVFDPELKGFYVDVLATRVRQQIPIFPVFAHPTLTKSSTYS